MVTEPRIESTIGETESGLPWLVSTRINDLARVNGWGDISLTLGEGVSMDPDGARERATEFEAAATALRIAADWVEDHADELKGHDR